MPLPMKKTLFVFLALACCAWAVVAQDDPDKDLKKVTRNLANYNIDPASNAGLLTESAALIEGVVKSSEFSQVAKAWQAYGDVYAEHVNHQTQALVLDPNAPVSAIDAITKTFKGYQNALKYAEKGYEKKDAINGLKTVLPNMYYLTRTILNRQDYENAYGAYVAVTGGDMLLKENGEEGIFDQGELQNAQFVTAVCANTSGKNEAAVSILEKLHDAQYDDPGVYEYLYKAYVALGQNDKAEQYLQEGRKKYPDDKGLLFAEINDALAKGKLEDLVGKLKLALKAEPNNISVPTTLGNVYDQLYQKKMVAADTLKAHAKNDSAMLLLNMAHAYYDSAVAYIQNALTLDSTHFDAIYMMGELQYNKAAELAKEMNALADDYSKEGTKKYEAKKAQMMQQFDNALPYFEKAEKLDPKDTNTLIALREIWARKGDLDKSNAYKAKLDAIQGN